MSRTPIFSLLRRSFRLAKAANQQQISAAEAVERAQAAAYSRRNFLKQGGLATIALGLPSALTSSCKKDETLIPTNIAIIGAGVAGLNCAYELKKAGYNSTIYEASKRTGGRMFSAKDIMATGLTTELGGEFIDTSHTTILRLAQEFGLPLIDTFAPSETALTKTTYFIGGTLYNDQQIVDAFMPIAAAMQADIDSLPDECDYKHATELAALDNVSISQYLSNIGASGVIKTLIEQAFMGEFGLEANEQSAINLLFIISADTSAGVLELYGESDERYKILGGNQQIPDKIAAQLNSGQVRLEHRLFKIEKNTSGYLLFFDENGRTVQTQADIVVMTLPFSILKNIQMNVPMSAEKKYAIQNLGYGTNAKLMLGMSSRPWRAAGHAGFFYSDLNIQQGWDNAQLQNGNAGAGGITLFSGGQNGINIGTGTAASQAAALLPNLERVLAGTTAAFNGNAQRMHWPSHPFSMGSYSAFRVGQYQTIAGREIETVDENIFFAGEHTSLAFQGYMNGGAYSGELAAKEVLKKAKK